MGSTGWLFVSSVSALGSNFGRIDSDSGGREIGAGFESGLTGAAAAREGEGEPSRD